MLQQLFKGCILHALVGSYCIRLVGGGDEQEPAVQPGLVLRALDDVDGERCRDDFGDDAVPVAALGCQGPGTGVGPVAERLNGFEDPVLVSSAMLAFSRLLSTKDTAVRDTPAALATSAMVTPRLPGPPAAGWAAGVAGPEGTS